MRTMTQTMTMRQDWCCGVADLGHNWGVDCSVVNLAGGVNAAGFQRVRADGWGFDDLCWCDSQAAAADIWGWSVSIATMSIATMSIATMCRDDCWCGIVCWCCVQGWCSVVCWCSVQGWCGVAMAQLSVVSNLRGVLVARDLWCLGQDGGWLMVN